MKVDLNININHLQYFCDTVRLGSLVKAANEHRVTQSTISQGITNLEKSMDCTLLFHKKRQLKVTSAGFILYREGNQLIKTLTDIKIKCKMQSEESGLIVIGLTHSLALAYLSKLKSEFDKDFKNRKVEWKVLSPITLFEEIKNGTIDIGLIIRNMPINYFKFHKLRTGLFKIYTHSSLKESSLSRGILVTEKFGNEIFELERLCELHYSGSYFLNQLVSSWEVLARLAKDGIGHVLIPDYIFPSYKDSLVEWNGGPQKIQIPYELGAVYKTGNNINNELDVLEKTIVT